jgi:Glycogen debranching enzyme N terminal
VRVSKEQTSVPSIIFGPQTCGSLAEGTGREWLVPDGRGGYAMGTVAGLRTRRYHALLVVAGARPAARQVGLVALDPVVELPSGARIRLATHEWVSGAVSPAGHVHLERFDLTDGLPRWRWRLGDVVVERELAMVPNRSALGVLHRLRAGGPVRLRLEALCTWRDAHGERFGSGPLETLPTADGVTLAGAYRLAGPGWQPAGTWYRNAYLRAEAARGLPATEDLWYAGQFVAELLPGEQMAVLAWAPPDAPRPPPAARVIADARARNRELAAPGGGLFDVLDPADPAVRPNQLIGYRLPHGPLRGRPVPAGLHALVTRSGCATWPRTNPGTGAGTAAARYSATRRTTRAPSGRGCSARTSTPAGPPASRPPTCWPA